MKKRICTKPFEWLEIFNEPEGGLYICCPGWLPTPIGNIAQTDAKTLWQGPLASQIRASVIDGSFKYCSKDFCPYMEDPDAPDSPMKDVDEYEYEEYQLAVIHPELYLPAPKTLNCAYDRSCNLQCPSCRVEILQASKEERAGYQSLINDVLDVFADDLETLYVTGSGDPFASRHYWELLTSDITDRYPKLKFRLHSNAILFTESRWQQLTHLHGKVQMIEISIDGGRKESYEINRYPAKWDTLVERMEFIAAIRQEYPDMVLKINHVVQANNWRDMRSLVTLAQRWGADILKFSKINNWGTYSPSEYRRVCVHEPGHPDFEAFQAYIADPLFAIPMIMMDNFLPTMPELIATDCALEPS
jgi:hypothetical protein